MVVNIEQELERASHAAFQSFLRDVVGTRGYRPTLSKPTTPQIEKRCADAPHVLTSTAEVSAPPRLLLPPETAIVEEPKAPPKPKVISGAFAEYMELMEAAEERRQEVLQDAKKTKEEAHATLVKQDALLSIGFQHLYSQYGRSWDI
jgi:hypothetical protein